MQPKGRSYEIAPRFHRISLRITVDYREKASGIIDLLRDEDVQIAIRKVSYGDYVINDGITIERKTARDFLISIIDGRLFNQMSNLKKHCIHPVLLIEGNPFKTGLDFDQMAIRGALISIQAIWYLPIIYSRGKEETKDIIMMIGRQEEASTDVVSLRGGYRPKRFKSRQLFLLQGLPKVGPTVAKRLLEHFRSVSNAMNATVEDLTQVEGIGRISAEKIREVLDIEYVEAAKPRYIKS
jgi:DNA excision repair protein ERCC-4